MNVLRDYNKEISVTIISKVDQLMHCATVITVLKQLERNSKILLPKKL